jgi:NAD(P)H-dependent flavin oxidoreductase YrpB (nitropropane dioxygenase family)
MTIQRSILNTARVIRNKAAEKTFAMEQRGATLEELIIVIIGQIGKKAIQEGELEEAIIVCGQCVGMVNDIKSVKEVIEEVIQGAQSILQKLNAFTNEKKV